MIDATCPLVTKVHLEVERYAMEGRTVILIGHNGHEEVKGTLGVAPGQVLLVGTVEEAMAVEVPDPSRVAATSQTTLSVDDTREIMETLKRRFPGARYPQDRRHLLRHPESAERGQRAGRKSQMRSWWLDRSRARTPTGWSRWPRCAGGRAYLVDSIAEVQPAMLDGVRSLGLTASASSPEWLVEEIIGSFARGGASVELLSVKKERVHFPLPLAAD